VHRVCCVISARAHEDCAVLLMQKIDTSSDFDEDWGNFKEGFGDVDEKYWLGNEQIHQLTKDGGYKARIEVNVRDEDDQPVFYWAEYITFIVGNEASNYLLSLDGYSGGSGYILSELNGTQFSTKDQNNGQGPNCALSRGGGFWYADIYCGLCFLTGATSNFYCLNLPISVSRIWLLCK